MASQFFVFAFSIESCLAISLITLIILIIIIWVLFAYLNRLVILTCLFIFWIIILMIFFLRIDLSKIMDWLTFILILLTFRYVFWFRSLWFLVDCYYLIYIIKIYYFASFFSYKYLLRSDTFWWKSHNIWMNFTFWFIKFKFIRISILNFIALSINPRDSGIIAFTFTLGWFDIIASNFRKINSRWEWIDIALEYIG